MPSARLRHEAKASDLVLPTPHAGQSADFRLRLPSPPPDDRIAVDAWTLGALAKVGKALFRGGFGSNTAAVFSRIDRNGDGLLSKDEFTAALKDRELGLGFSDAEIVKILSVVDANASGNMSVVGCRTLACRALVLVHACLPCPQKLHRVRASVQGCRHWVLAVWIALAVVDAYAPRRGRYCRRRSVVRPPLGSPADRARAGRRSVRRTVRAFWAQLAARSH